MATVWKILCPFCGDVFKHRHPEPPDECPLCNQYVGPDGKPEVAAPFISLKGGKTPDQLYRAMENGAQHRMEMAAEATGEPVSEFSHMKVTDMKDNLREGDIAYKAPAMSPVQASMKAGSSFAHPGASPEAQAAIASATQGPHARAGSRMIPIVNEIHRRHRQPV